VFICVPAVVLFVHRLVWRAGACCCASSYGCIWCEKDWNCEQRDNETTGKYATSQQV